MAKMDDVKPVSSGYDFGDDWLGELEDALEFDDKNEDKRDEKVTPDDSSNPDQLDDMEVIELSEDDYTSENDVDLGDELFESMPEIEMDLAFDAEDNLNVPFEDVPAPPQPPRQDYQDIPLSIETDPEKESEDVLTDQDIEVSLDTSPDIPMSVDTEIEHETIRSVVTQTLDIEELRREVGKHTETPSGEHTSADPLKDPQLWQFVSLIIMHLFDDLELMLIQKQNDEACDLMKQLNRLSNILAFAGLDEHLPLIAYIGNFLPLSFTEVGIGEHSERKFDPLKMRHFIEKSNEFLNCLVHLLTCLASRAVGFDTSRFTNTLEELYRTLDLKPGLPSIEAPLALTDNVNPHELTSRTVNKLARTLEALVTESLHYVESAVNYGYSSGYADAAKSLNMATQVAREYKLDDIENATGRLFLKLKDCRLTSPLPDAVLEDYSAVCDLLESHFVKQITEKKLKHLKTLLTKFNNKDIKETNIPFSIRWKSFIKQATPLFVLDHVKYSELRQRGQAIIESAKTHNIQWITKTFEHIEHLWDIYEDSCAEALISLIQELQGFPADDVEEADVENLNHERLQILFARKHDSKPTSTYALVRLAQQLTESLQQNLENLAQISSAQIQDLLIDARQVHCHAIARTCEVLLTLLERVPQNAVDNSAIPESVFNAMYFTTELLQSICARLSIDLEHNPDAPSITSRYLFYNVLNTLYQTPGQPRDSVTWFIAKRLNQILSELQLVWDNSSTPTSTEYYISLIKTLLHLTTICEMNDASRLLSTHLDEIPKADFINTDNRSMNRACMRVVRSIEETCPHVHATPGSEQIEVFFAKLITAFNQLLSSQDIQAPDDIRSEISRIESRISVLGMTTNFPSAIALLYELHHLSYLEDIGRPTVEDFLYELINVANNVSPEWNQPREADLEFVKTAIAIPMPFYQEIIESVTVIRDALILHKQEDPIAWERADMLYHSVHNLINYVPNSLQIVSQNAQNRCRYLKKNITIDIDTNGYPNPEDIPKDSVRAIASVAFITIIDKLLEMIIDNAFASTNTNSRITIVLHPFVNELSVSILHNGSKLTLDEFLDQLSRVNIMPASDENLLDLLVSAKLLSESYPPVNALAYILPILRQFDGVLEPAKDNSGLMRFYLSFKF
ncbi:MAG: hypothetical protein J6A01_03880 [Proteobacteria bacterium]|nr:hypothetical protein [Pseudomonadota bacterium]